VSREVITQRVSAAIFKIMGTTYWGHELDLTRSHDVIDHVTNRFATCPFLLVTHWNEVSIFNRFQDICIQIYLGHDLDLSGSHDVTSHVTISYPMPLPTSDVQNNIFTGFIDTENVGLAVGIAFLSALDPKLQAIMFNTAAILESNMADMEVQTNDFAGFLDHKNVGYALKSHFYRP